jgi:hypothetical protein
VRRSPSMPTHAIQTPDGRTVEVHDWLLAHS